MKIKAVTFDVGGTLIEPWPSVGHIYANVAARHGVKNLSPEMLNACFKTSWNSRSPFGHSRTAWMDLVDEVFDNLTPEPPSKTFFGDLYEQFAQPEAWRIFDDVLPALDALASRDIKLGVISNWDERLRGLLQSLKLDRYFEVITVSCEVGFCKPSQLIFEHAATKLGLPSNAILHVGDSREMDVAGAKSAGFNALRIYRKGGQAADDDIPSLGELSERIEKLQFND